MARDLGPSQPALQGSGNGTPAPDLMPAALREAFVARAQSQRVRKGQVIISEGSDTKDVYLVRAGLFRVYLYSRQGREVILRDVGEGQLAGEMAAIEDLPRSCSVMAIGDGEVSRMSGDQFLDFLSSVPDAGLWMIRQLSDRIRDLTTRSFDLVTLPVGSRVQRELLRLAGEQVDDGTDRCLLPDVPTHAEIAARVGTHREAVTREMSLLAKAGIIRKIGRDIEIVSLHELTSLHERMRK